MDNINNILSKIDNDLFSQTDIDLIDEKMEEKCKLQQEWDYIFANNYVKN